MELLNFDSVFIKLLKALARPKNARSGQRRMISKTFCNLKNSGGRKFSISEREGIPYQFSNQSLQKEFHRGIEEGYPFEILLTSFEKFLKY